MASTAKRIGIHLSTSGGTWTAVQRRRLRSQLLPDFLVITAPMEALARERG